MTQEALERSLDRELGWRKKELLSLRASAAYADGVEQLTLIRCLVLLSYAHWEGFVKKPATLYFDYVISQTRSFRELTDNLVAAEVSRLACADTAKVSYYKDTTYFLRYGQDDIACVNMPHDISDMGMLDSGRLKNILYCLAIEELPFELKYNWLDRSLLAERNRIAHGEYLQVDLAYLSFCDDTLGLIEILHRGILHAAVSRTYLRQALLPISGERL